MNAPNTNNPLRINVVIGDGRRLVREGLAMLLEKDRVIRVVGEADDARGAARLIGPLAADVVILIMPGGSGVIVRGAIEVDLAVTTVRETINSGPRVRLIVLTPGLSSPDLRQIIRAGAAGCLTMDCTSDELIAAVRHAVAGGEVYLSERLREQVARRYVNAASMLSSGVSELEGSLERDPKIAPRETEVLKLIASGQSTKEIAAALHVGTKTIETHRRRLMEKLNRHSVAELTQYAILKGLIELSRNVEV